MAPEVPAPERTGIMREFLVGAVGFGAFVAIMWILIYTLASLAESSNQIAGL